MLYFDGLIKCIKQVGMTGHGHKVFFSSAQQTVTTFIKKNNILKHERMYIYVSPNEIMLS
jgi:hypothetical protein